MVRFTGRKTGVTGFGKGTIFAANGGPKNIRTNYKHLWPESFSSILGADRTTDFVILHYLSNKAKPPLPNRTMAAQHLLIQA